jgi:hypothetical protein
VLDQRVEGTANILLSDGPRVVAGRGGDAGEFHPPEREGVGTTLQLVPLKCTATGSWVPVLFE